MTKSDPGDDRSGYGACAHYLGSAGGRYFKWQDAHPALRGQLEGWKFRTYVDASKSVLDFGCGGGHVLAALPASLRVGVELNPAAREQAAQRLHAVHESLTHVPSNHFDVAISNHALEHIPYPIGALRSIRRCLKPGGTLIICLPLDDWRTQKVYDPRDINHHLSAWTPQSLGNTMYEAGYRFRPTDIRVIAHSWPPFYARLSRLPPRLFDMAAHLSSIFMRRRQLLCVARRSW